MKRSELSQQSLAELEQRKHRFHVELIDSCKMYPFSLNQIVNFVELNHTCLIERETAQKYLGIKSPVVYRKLTLSNDDFSIPKSQSIPNLLISSSQNTQNHSIKINQTLSQSPTLKDYQPSVIVQILLVDKLQGQIHQENHSFSANHLGENQQEIQKQKYPVLYAPYAVYKHLLDIYHKQSFNILKQQFQLYQINLSVNIQRFPISYGKNFKVESIDEEADKITITGIKFPKNQTQANELKDLITKLIIHPKYNFKAKKQISSPQTSLSEFLIFPKSYNNRVAIDISWLDQSNFLKHLNKMSLQLKTKLLHLKKQNDKNSNHSSNRIKNFIEFQINYKSIKTQRLNSIDESKICIVKFVPGKTQIQFESNPSLKQQNLQPFIKIVRLCPIYKNVYQNHQFYHRLGQRLNIELSSDDDHFVCLKTDKSIGIGSLLQSYTQNILNKRFIRINCENFATQSEFYSRLKQIKDDGDCLIFIKNIHWLQNLSKNQDIVQQTMKSLVQKINNNLKQGYSNSFNHFTCLLYFTEGNLPQELPTNAKRWQIQLQKSEKLVIVDQIFAFFEKQFEIDFGIKETVKNTIGNSVGWTKIYKFLLQALKKEQNDLNEKNVSKAIQKYFNMENVENVAEVSWSDIGGLETAKQQIIQTVLLPTKHPEIFDEWIRPRTGLLFYGPPGTGKTLLGKCIAKQCKMGFISVKGPQLLNMYVGESEKNVRQIFERAKQSKPCIVFMDQLDALVPKRGNSSDGNAVMDRIVAELLMQIDMASDHQVFVIGATNRPDLLDPSILRAGRFDKQIYLGISKNKQERIKILKAQTRNSKLQDNFNFELIVDKVPQNFTGADFYGLTSKAMMKAVERSIDKLESGQQSDPEVLISEQDFLEVVETVKPSVTEEQLKHYESLKQRFS